MVYEIVTTPHGSFEFVQTVTLGEVLVSSAVFLLLSFHVLRWLLDSVWGKGGRP